ncbi:MAG: SDR family oxidoreductase [Rhodospirillales bacterium]|nr:SDR family oxidoreductase [Rhodospirillales bacterium]
MNLLVTGASGFVGQHLCRALTKRGHRVTAAVRASATPETAAVAQRVVVGDIGPDTDWSAALVGQQAIFHLAARAHVMAETTADPEPLYHRVNVEGTANLLAQAKSAGVVRIIFLSSIKVNGEQTTTHPFTEAMAAAPQDAYGRTKRDAELLLERDPELVATIIRAPLVYGPGVKGNFLKLLGLCDRGWPLPIGRIANQRSLIYLDNLVDALILSLEHAKSAGQTFLVSDGEDVSTPELFERTAVALGKPSRLLPVPLSVLRLAGLLTGKSATIDRLCGSLQIDNRHICQQLGWKPPVSLQQGLDKTVNWYQKHSQPEGSQGAS